MANRVAKALTVVGLLLANALHATAQEDVPPVGHRFGGGVIGGVNISQVDGDGYGGYKALGGIGGLWLSRQFGQSDWGLRIELRYIGKGSRSVGVFGGKEGVRTTSYAFTLHYLELPIYAEYVFLKQFAAYIGIGASYLLAWRERNAYGEFDKSTRLAPRGYEISVQVALAWCFHRHWGVRGGFSYSVVPIRGMPDRLMGQRRGQYNNILYVALQYEI